MKRLYKTICNEYKANTWLFVFAVTLPPAIILAEALGLLCPALRGLFTGLALFGSIVWAGLKDGPGGRLGFFVWVLAAIVATLVVFVWIVVLPVQTRRIRFTVGGHGFIVEMIPQYEPHTAARRAHWPEYNQKVRWT